MNNQTNKTNNHPDSRDGMQIEWFGCDVLFGIGAMISMIMSVVNPMMIGFFIQHYNVSLWFVNLAIIQEILYIGSAIGFFHMGHSEWSKTISKIRIDLYTTGICLNALISFSIAIHPAYKFIYYVNSINLIIYIGTRIAIYQTSK